MSELNYTIIQDSDCNKVYVIDLPATYRRKIYEVANRNNGTLIDECWKSKYNDYACDYEPFCIDGFNYSCTFEFSNKPYACLFEWDINLTLEIIRDFEHNLKLEV